MSHSRVNSMFLGTPALWIVRVCAWIAFLISAYLAWTSLGHIPIAGCAGSGLFDCDAVHNSSWSMWLSLPVALAGLACYAMLAGLSVVAGWKIPSLDAWIRASLLMFSFVAAGAAIWFILLQLAVIGSICAACMAVHFCGLVIGCVIGWSVFRQSTSPGTSRISHAGIAALRSAMPIPGKLPPIAPRQSGTARFGWALGGAAALLTALVGGQILFPAKTYNVQAVKLDQPIDMTGSSASDDAAAAENRSAQPHVTMRVSEEEISGDTSQRNDESAGSDEISSDKSQTETTDAESPKSPPAATAGSEIPHSESNGESEVGDDAGNDDSGSESTGGQSFNERIIKLLGGKLTIDVFKQPVLGAPDAPHVLVELVSYDCPHCRKAHSIVKQGRQRYGDQLAVVVLPVPLDQKCNRLVTSYNPEHRGSCALARHAMAVAAVDPAAFEEYHEWLMAGEKAPSAEKAMAKAYALVGRERALGVAYSDALNKRISENVELFATLQKQHSANRNFGLPIQIMKNGVMSGATKRADDVYRTWEEHLGLQPPLKADTL